MWVKAREREKNKEKHVNGAMFLTQSMSHMEYFRGLDVQQITSQSHWGQGYLNFSGNMLSTLQALRYFAQHLPSRNILFTFRM
jgi:hypothetical protein